MSAGDLALKWQTRRGQNKAAVPRLIAIVRAGVVFPDMDRAVADAPNRAPVKIAEMGDQIRRDVAYRAIDFIGLINSCAERPALSVHRRLKHRFDLVAESFVRAGLNHPVRLPPFALETHSPL